ILYAKRAKRSFKIFTLHLSLAAPNHGTSVKQWKNFRAADLFGAFLLLLALGALLFAAALKVIAQSPPSNAAPVANAGPDQTISLPDQAILRGWAVDDGVPNPPGTLIYQWSELS